MTELDKGASTAPKNEAKTAKIPAPAKRAAKRTAPRKTAKASAKTAEVRSAPVASHSGSAASKSAATSQTSAVKADPAAAKSTTAASNADASASKSSAPAAEKSAAATKPDTAAKPQATQKSETTSKSETAAKSDTATKSETAPNSDTATKSETAAKPAAGPAETMSKATGETLAKAANGTMKLAEKAVKTPMPMASGESRVPHPAVEKVVAQSKAKATKAVDQIRSLSDDQARAFDVSVQSWQGGMGEMQKKLMEFTQVNMATGLEFFRKMMTVRDVPQAIALQQEFLKHSVESFTTQGRELAGLATGLQDKARKPLQDNVIRSLEQVRSARRS